MCTIIQMGSWKGVLIIMVSSLVRCPDFDVLSVLGGFINLM